MEAKESARQLVEKTVSFIADQCTVAFEERGERTVCQVNCPDNSILIGYRGETLRALQYIVNLLAKKQIGPDAFLEIDVGSYKAEQDKKIEEYADRIITKVINSGRAEVMRAMNSAERRLVHLVCSVHPQVECESVGEDPNRKVIVRNKRAEA